MFSDTIRIGNPSEGSLTPQNSGLEKTSFFAARGIRTRWRSPILEIAALAGTAFFIHAVVLSYIFPGYYRPLWPHHSDFYIPISLAQSVQMPSDYIKGRPVGFLFAKAIGRLGLHGSILATIGVVVLNCSLTAFFIRRILGIKADGIYWIAFSIYVFLVFSHPHFYVISNWDGFSQISYTLLLLSGWCFFLYLSSPTSPLRLFFAVVLSLSAFLAKETYGLSALCIATIAGFYCRRQSGLIRSAIPAISVVVTLAGAMMINTLNGSPFIGVGQHVSDPYHVVLTPVSVIREWVRYAAAGLNAIHVSLLLLTAIAGALLSRRDSRYWMAICLPIAGALAWLPNSVLPNHFFPGYLWNGAYLLFASVFFASSFWRESVPYRFISIAVIVTALVSPVYSLENFKKNEWTLNQEKIQRNILNALSHLSATLPPSSRPDKILITGWNGPFNPFDHGMWVLPDFEGIEFHILQYTDRRGGGKNLKLIGPDDVDITNYPVIWGFRSDGSLVVDKRDVLNTQSEPPLIFNLKPDKLLIYPELIDIAGYPEKGEYKTPDGGKYLQCGGALLNYNNLVDAKYCLKSSASLIPANPYSFFYLGEIMKRQGDLEGSRRYFSKAIERDDKNNPNPNFSQNLDHVDQLLRQNR